MAHEISLNLASGSVLRLRTLPNGFEVTVFAGYHLHLRVDFHEIVSASTLRIANTDLLLGSHAIFIVLTLAEAAVLTAFLAMCKEGT